MRAKLVLVGMIALLLASPVSAQKSGQKSGGPKSGGLGKAPKLKDPEAPDEEREILKQIKEAYKAPYEVHKDVLSELRKQYRDPTPDRESKIIKELRRLYVLSPEQED